MEFIKADIAKKVEQLKNSFTVEGVPLVKSNRFSDEELNEMKSTSTAHSSHWHGMKKGAKIYSDEEIATQIEVFFNTPNISEEKFSSIKNKLFKSLPLKDKNKEKQALREILFSCLNWTEERNGLSKMWAPFGSAPSGDDETLHGEKLQLLQQKYGACSMGTIFNGEFSEKFHIFWYSVNNTLHEFDTYWDLVKSQKDLKETAFSSPYNTLDEIEENVVMKKIPEAAKNFYLDKTKSFEERLKVFAAHGKQDSSIFQPTNRDLKIIFDVYSENGWIERHQIVKCEQIVEYWIDKLIDNRCHLDWTNKYHPKVATKSRNYKPSQKAIDRLHRYYMEKLFLDGIGSFEWDW